MIGLLAAAIASRHAAQQTLDQCALFQVQLYEAYIADLLEAQRTGGIGTVCVGVIIALSAWVAIPLSNWLAVLMGIFLPIILIVFERRIAVNKVDERFEERLSAAIGLRGEAEKILCMADENLEIVRSLMEESNA